MKLPEDLITPNMVCPLKNLFMVYDKLVDNGLLSCLLNFNIRTIHNLRMTIRYSLNVQYLI